MDRLARADIAHALDALARELALLGSRCELIVVGGAAMALLYDGRESTKDVDVVIATTDVASLRAAAATVATELDLPFDWLNDAAKGYVHGLALGAIVLDTASLLVRAVAPEQLLAMKLSAWRDDIDIADARLLLSKLPGSRDAVWALAEPYLVPGRELKARYAFDDLWEADRGDS